MSNNGTNGSGQVINFVRPHCKHTDGPYHDCAYVERLNALIPEAARQADMVAGPMPVGHGHDALHNYYADWNAIFHGEMDRLAQAAGVRGAPSGVQAEPETLWDPGAAIDFDQEEPSE